MVNQLLKIKYYKFFIFFAFAGCKTACGLGYILGINFILDLYHDKHRIYAGHTHNLCTSELRSLKGLSNMAVAAMTPHFM